MHIFSLVSNLSLTNEAHVTSIWICQSKLSLEVRDKDQMCQNEENGVQQFQSVRLY